MSNNCNEYCLLIPMFPLVKRKTIVLFIFRFQTEQLTHHNLSEVYAKITPCS